MPTEYENKYYRIASSDAPVEVKEKALKNLYEKYFGIKEKAMKDIVESAAEIKAGE